MKLSRRQMLAMIAAAGAVSMAGAVTVGAQWWDQGPDAPWAALAEEEATVVRAVAGAAFPSGRTIALHGKDAELDRFFDALLQAVPATQRKLLKLLLHALDAGALATSGARLGGLSETEQRAFVMGLLNHPIAEVRGAVQGLVVLLGMGYTTHPAVAPVMSTWHRCGYGA